MTQLRDVPLDLLQEASAALDRYVRARRKARLRQKQARLQAELLNMRTDLAEIQALATHPAKALTTCHEGVASGAMGNVVEENHA